MNSVDGPPAPVVPHQPIMDLPPIKLSPETSGAPYSVSPHTGVIEVENDGTEVVIIPVAPSPLNRTPNTLKTEHKMRKENSFAANSVNPVDGRLSNMLPGMFLSPVKSIQLKPPVILTLSILCIFNTVPVNREHLVCLFLSHPKNQKSIKNLFENIILSSVPSEVRPKSHFNVRV